MSVKKWRWLHDLSASSSTWFLSGVVVWRVVRMGLRCLRSGGIRIGVVLYLSCMLVLGHPAATWSRGTPMGEIVCVGHAVCWLGSSLRLFSSLVW